MHDLSPRVLDESTATGWLPKRVARGELTMSELEVRSREGQRIMRELEALPSLPCAVREMTELDIDSPNFVEDVARIAEGDASIARHILRIANVDTPLPPEPIESIPEAVVHMGSRAVSELTASISALRVFPPTSPEHVELWQHANQVAVIAQDIAEDRSIGIDPQSAFLAGLLHDLGRFLLFEHDPQAISEVSVHGWPTPSSLIAAERAAFGVQHADLGFKMCQQWGLAPAVCHIVRLHHTFGTSDEMLMPQVERCLPIVQQADHLSALLVRERGLLAMSFSDRRAIIGAHCMTTYRAPVSPPTRLAERLDIVVGRSRELLRDLGLGSSEPAG
ncbi:MAG: HDOD domain-containing protein [Planctomycetes bacterium]|nr:HDOD domain-containing protein [Planctomycetota bacterium]